MQANAAEYNSSSRLIHSRSVEVVQCFFAFKASEVRENQFREVTTVAAFEQAEYGKAEGANFFAQPIKVLCFQGFLGDRVLGVGVEAGRDADEVGLEFVQIVQRGVYGVLFKLAPGTRSILSQ